MCNDIGCYLGSDIGDCLIVLILMLADVLWWDNDVLLYGKRVCAPWLLCLVCTPSEVDYCYLVLVKAPSEIDHRVEFLGMIQIFEIVVAMLSMYLY